MSTLFCSFLFLLKSCGAKVIEEIRSLQREARLLLAGRLLSEVDKFLASGVEAHRKEVKAAVYLLSDTFQDSMSELRRRASECSSTLREWHSVRTSRMTTDAKNMRRILCPWRLYHGQWLILSQNVITCMN